jgi:hypothetical protein
VNKLDEPQFSGHLDDLMVPYIEGRLSLDDQALVEKHLMSCPECLSAAEDLHSIVVALEKNKGAFCPQPQELYDFAVSDHEPEGRLAEHLKECGSCRAELESYGHTDIVETMPSELWNKVRLSVRETIGHKPSFDRRESTLQGYWDRLSQWFKIPVMAAGTAAAAILLLVLFYPTSMPETMIGLSSVTWDKVPKPKATLQSGLEGAAVVIFLKDFKKRLPQEQIDSIYRAMEPGMELMERYRIITPAMFTDAVHKKKINPYDRKEMLESLRKNFDVSKTVVVTVSYGADGLIVDSLLINTAAGNIIRSKTDEAVKPDDLGSKIREAVKALMVPS